MQHILKGYTWSIVLIAGVLLVNPAQAQVVIKERVEVQALQQPVAKVADEEDWPPSWTGLGNEGRVIPRSGRLQLLFYEGHGWEYFTGAPSFSWIEEARVYIGIFGESVRLIDLSVQPHLCLYSSVFDSSRQRNYDTYSGCFAEYDDPASAAAPYDFPNFTVDLGDVVAGDTLRMAHVLGDGSTPPYINWGRSPYAPYLPSSSNIYGFEDENALGWLDSHAGIYGLTVYMTLLPELGGYSLDLENLTTGDATQLLHDDTLWVHIQGETPEGHALPFGDPLYRDVTALEQVRADTLINVTLNAEGAQLGGLRMWDPRQQAWHGGPEARFDLLTGVSIHNEFYYVADGACAAEEVEVEIRVSNTEDASIEGVERITASPLAAIEFTAEPTEPLLPFEQYAFRMRAVDTDGNLVPFSDDEVTLTLDAQGNEVGYLQAGFIGPRSDENGVLTMSFDELSGFGGVIYGVREETIADTAWVHDPWPVSLRATAQACEWTLTATMDFSVGGNTYDGEAATDTLLLGETTPLVLQAINHAAGVPVTVPNETQMNVFVAEAPGFVVIDKQDHAPAMEVDRLARQSRSLSSAGTGQQADSERTPRSLRTPEAASGRMQAIAAGALNIAANDPLDDPVFRHSRLEAELFFYNEFPMIVRYEGAVALDTTQGFFLQDVRYGDLRDSLLVYQAPEQHPYVALCLADGEPEAVCNELANEPVDVMVLFWEGGVTAPLAPTFRTGAVRLTLLAPYFEVNATPNPIAYADTAFVHLEARDRDDPDFDEAFTVEVSLDDSEATGRLAWLEQQADGTWAQQATGPSLMLDYTVLDTSYTTTDRLVFIAESESIAPPVAAAAKSSMRASEASLPEVKITAVHSSDPDKRGVETIELAAKVEILNAAGERTDFVQIARWDNAYTDAPDYDVFNEANAEDHFIDRDPERFVVRVHDQAANGNDATVDTLSVRLGIEGTQAMDDLTRITLFETGPATGIFDSKSQLLTAWDFPIPDEGATPLRYTDDNFPVHDGLQGTVADDAPNDRTHQGAVGETVRALYEAVAGEVIENAVSVCHPDSIRTLEIQITVFNEPYLDEGYIDPITQERVGADNGAFDFVGKAPGVKHQPGVRSERYRDLSAYNREFQEGPLGTGGGRLMNIPHLWSGDDPLSLNGDGFGGVVSNEHVQAELLRAQVAWAQACIVIEHVNVTEPIDVPASIRRRMQLAGKFNTGDGDDLVKTYNDEMEQDILYVFFTPPMDFSVDGETYLPSDSDGRLGDYSVSYIAAGADIGPDLRVLAHEIGHALSNRNDVKSERYIFFPQTPRPFPDTDVNTERRLALETVNLCRTPRPPGAYHQPGNLLLKLP